jgi:hypothetical protein
MPFSRHHLWPHLLEAYRSMDVIIHVLVFADEELPSPLESWTIPYTAPFNSNSIKEQNIHLLINHFLKKLKIVDEDYYVIVPDDDLYEAGVFDVIKTLNDPVIFISMRRCLMSTLIACPENVKVGYIGGEQVFMKGSIAKNIQIDTEVPCSDGLLAIELKDKYPIHYEPKLFCLFNYFAPWSLSK